MRQTLNTTQGDTVNNKRKKSHTHTANTVDKYSIIIIFKKGEKKEKANAEKDRINQQKLKQGTSKLNHYIYQLSAYKFQSLVTHTDYLICSREPRGNSEIKRRKDANCLYEKINQK